MIDVYETFAGRPRRYETGASDQTPVWVDVVSPSESERKTIAREYGITLPMRADMDEIETSSRLYLRDGATFMTATIPIDVEGEDPRNEPVIFILKDGTLVTQRFSEPRAWRSFLSGANERHLGGDDGAAVLLGLLDEVIDRLADILENTGRRIAGLSQNVLRSEALPPGRKDYRSVLRDVGQQGDIISHVQDSLVSLERVGAYLQRAVLADAEAEPLMANAKSVLRDARYLTEHSNFLSQKVSFLLDATLGMIGIEQNGIIKILSVAAVLFLPPTLIASIYGMNFSNIPELHWAVGYPAALLLMVLSGVLSYWFFKRQGWL